MTASYASVTFMSSTVVTKGRSNSPIIVAFSLASCSINNTILCYDTSMARLVFKKQALASISNQALPSPQKPRSGWFGWPSAALGSSFQFVSASADLIPRDSPPCPESPERRALLLEGMRRHAGKVSIKGDFSDICRAYVGWINCPMHLFGMH